MLGNSHLHIMRLPFEKGKRAPFERTQRALPEQCLLPMIDFQVSRLSLSFFTSLLTFFSNCFQIFQRSENAATAGKPMNAGLLCRVPFVLLSVTGVTEPHTPCVPVSSRMGIKSRWFRKCLYHFQPSGQSCVVSLWCPRIPIPNSGYVNHNETLIWQIKSRCCFNGLQ